MKDLVTKKFNIISIAVIVMVLVVACFFGSRKQGFYIDEYYLYCLANGTQVGMDIDVGEWNNTDRYVSQLVSEGDENFHFRQAYEIIRDGTHPPLYYYLVHFVSSIFSGVFSKWIGLSANIALLVPIMILVKKIAWKLSGNNEVVTLASMLLYGLSPATISMVVMVRMYLLLSLWALLYAYVHIMDLGRDKLSVPKFLLPVFVCGFFGFQTQYMFVVFMFFITFTYGFYLLVSCRRVKDVIIYGFTALISLISTHLVWPYSYFHIVQGPRGKGAISQVRDIPNFFYRLKTHMGYMDQMMFGGLLPVFMILLVIGIFLIIKKYLERYRLSGMPVLPKFSVSSRGFIMIVLASILSFVALSQVALTDGIMCFRHTYILYSLFLTILPVGLYRLFVYLKLGKGRLAYIIILAGIAVILVSGFAQKRVLFLYENEKDAIMFAKEHPDEKVVMFENNDGNYDSVMQQMIMYPKVFFALSDEPETAEDEEIANADELLVYMTTRAKDKDACFEAIYQQNPKITKAEHLWDFDFFSVYLMN